MLKKTALNIVTVLLLAAPALGQELAPGSANQYNCDFNPDCEVAPGMYGKMGSNVLSKFNLSIGGFVKLDYVHNSENLGTNGALATLQPAGIPKASSPAAKQDQSLFTARQSRLWFKVVGPSLLGAKSSALVETDFYGSGGNNESGNLRMRHAYGTLDWENTQLLFGQYWDAFGLATASTLDFGLGATAGSPQQPRVAQIRGTQKVRLTEDNTLRFALAVQNPVQDSNLQTGAANDSWSGAVNVAGQAMLVSKSLGVSPGFWGLSMNSLQTGFFGLYGKENLGGNNHPAASWGYGLYAFVPILRAKDGKSRAMTASFEGQVYMADNMAFNYATAASLTGVAGQKSGAKGYGLFGQAIFYPTNNLGFTAGYGTRNAYNYGTYAGSENFQKASSQIFANVAYDLNAAIRVAGEYQHVNTDYGNNTPGTAPAGFANIYRLSLFYFF
ncbi:MAG TPA: hypothetical protein VJ550_16460 [Geomonas sp.]|nr:hypothetical protein [Geomonas sp.]